MKRNIRILIVEDEILVAEMIHGLLEDIGYEVIGMARNGMEGVEMTNKLKPDVVLMDIQMPGMDGIEATHQIFNTCPTPVVALTAYSNSELIEKASRAGVGSYLLKPPVSNEIERSITITLARFQDMMELRRLNTELQEANASKDKFFGIIAHDLKTPLASLQAYIELLTDNINDLSKDEIIVFTQTLKKMYDNMEALLENLLTWSRIQRGMIVCEPQIINIKTFADLVVYLLDPAAKQKEISFYVNIVDPTMAYADSNMVEAILRNLISNAIKFTHAGGKISISASVDESKETSEKYVSVSVTDTGVGIPETLISNLFQIHSAKSTRGTNDEIGTGLGLVLCKEFAHRNNGRIWCKSKIDEGSTFTFTLPASCEK